MYLQINEREVLGNARVVKSYGNKKSSMFTVESTEVDFYGNMLKPLSEMFFLSPEKYNNIWNGLGRHFPNSQKYKKDGEEIQHNQPCKIILL